MTNKTENLIPVQLSRVEDSEAELPAEPLGKKKFVELEVSSAVDVLEATTFFQVVDSGLAPP